jgi:predicted nucleotidyltransferase
MDEKNQLKEREKELNCLYQTDRLLSEENDLYKLLNELCKIIADAFLYPTLTRVKIRYFELIVCSPYFNVQKDNVRTNIMENGQIVGEILVYYSSDSGHETFKFLPEEKKLLESVGKRLSDYFSIRSTSCFLAKDRKNIFTLVRNEICNNAVNTMRFGDFGIKNIYLIGSVKNYIAGISSDIDLIIHFDGLKENAEKIKIWFEAWSASILSDSKYDNEIKDVNNLFDIHLITDKDIVQKNSYAVMIDSLYNNAKKIK